MNIDLNVTCVRETNTMIKIYINGQLSSSNYAEDQSEIVSLKYRQLCKSTAIFNSIIVSSFGYSYKDALETNEKVIHVKSAIAEATSEVEGHEVSKAIYDNEVTYWFSKEEKDQSIKVSLDRSVFIEKVAYIAGLFKSY